MNRKRAYEFILQTHGTTPVDIVNAKKIVERPEKKLKKALDIVSELHCYKPLKVTTQVPALLDNRTHPITKVKLPRVKSTPKSIKDSKNSSKAYYDIWDDPKQKEDEVQELTRVQNEMIGKEPVKVPDHLYQKPTLRSSVETPMAGLSYNPREQDHQHLLKTAVVVEEGKLREEGRLAKQVTSNFIKKSEIDPNAWMTEMSQGLGSDEEDVEQESSGDYVPSRKPVVCKRKTKAQRAREKKNKMLRQKSKSKTPKDQTSIKKVLKEMRQKEVESEERIKKRDEKRIKKLHLGNEARVDEDIVVSLSNELRGNLRQVAVAGNLLEERFKSLQKRGLIEAKGRRTDDKKKKVRTMKKTKMFVKRNHRNVEA